MSETDKGGGHEAEYHEMSYLLLHATDRDDSGPIENLKAVLRDLKRLQEDSACRLAEAEQRAWDGAYDKALLAILTRGQLYGAGEPGAGANSREAQSMDAAAYADAKLEQRRLRFGAGKEAQSAPNKVLVPAGVLLGAGDLLEYGGSEEHRKASAAVLRALVSE